MKRLPPMKLKDEQINLIEREIQRLFNTLIYKPLVNILHTSLKEITNSSDALIVAVRDGRVFYEAGAFRGSFNAVLSRQIRDMGAKYDPATQSWKLPKDLVTPDILIAQANADMANKAMHEAVIDQFNNFNPDAVDTFSETPDKYDEALKWMDDDFRASVKSISIPAKLSEQQRATLAIDYGNNLDLYIKRWAEENIINLRAKVQQHALNGGRAEGLVKLIQDNYTVSKAKAKFLARQETSLLMSKFQESRYADVGVTKYIWGSSGDVRERPDHRLLNGKLFDFSMPPITNRETGARNNPGCDWGCRCFAIPVVD